MLKHLKPIEQKTIVKDNGPALSDIGQNRIRALILTNYSIYLPSLFDWSLVNKQGKLAKRLAKYMYKEHGIKLTDKEKSEIGNITNNYSIQDSYTFDITNEFDWYAGEFGDDGSCFWGQNAAAKDMMLDNGGQAIRFYDEHNNGYARAWIMPVETYDTNAVVVFNGYGIQALEAAQVLAQHLNVDYVKHISLVNMGNDTGTLWINGGVGYVVSETEFYEDYYDFKIYDDYGYYCDDCGEPIHEDEIFYTDHETLCEHCFYERYTFCANCGEIVDIAYTVTNYNTGETYCEGCAKQNDLYQCKLCNECHHIDDLTIIADSATVCDYCKDKYYTECKECHQLINNDYLNSETNICDDCQEALDNNEIPTCLHCNEPLPRNDDNTRRNYGDLCLYCALQLHHGHLPEMSEAIYA